MSTFVRAARYVGDLDDEFYRDERRRDIWNEASAVGLQLFLWIVLFGAAVLPFAAGVVGAWVALGSVAAFLVAAFATVAYARSRGVDAYTTQKTFRPRIVLFLFLYFVGVGGAMIRLILEYADGNRGIWIGMAIGAPIGVACAAIGVARRQRLQRAEEEAAEEAEIRAFEEEK